MSKVNLLKNLAKLRQFSPSGDVKDYLQNEMRQNLRAIEEALKGGYEPNDSTGIATEPGGLSLAVATANLTLTNSYSTLSLTDDNSSAPGGTITTNKFFPTVAGRYLIDMSLRYISGGGSQTVSAKAMGSDGIIINEIFYINTSPLFESKHSFFVDLTPTYGLYFQASCSGAATMLSRFYCKLYKVS